MLQVSDYLTGSLKQLTKIKNLVRFCWILDICRLSVTMLVNAHAWYDAYIAIFLVSALPNLFLILIPSKLLTTKAAKGALNYQNMLLTFAAAGLLGDVFLHTLPHLIAPHSHSHGGAHHDGHEGHDHHDQDDEHHDHEHHDHDHYEDAHEHHDHDHHDHGFEAHSHAHEDLADAAFASGHDHGAADLYSQIGLERSVVIGIVLLLGFLVFMFAEKIASGHSHGHSHGHHSDDEHTDESDAAFSTATATTTAKNDLASPTAVRRSSRINDNKAAATPSPTTTATSTTTSTTTASTTSTTTTSNSLFAAMQTNLKASGWLNLIADSMHNFTDGIAIGASFASGHGLAYATFLSVIFHEIPHEIGDFTILIQSGLTKSQAIKAQFVTAIAAVLGVSVGLLARRSETAEELLLSFTAGGFLYLAAVNMLPSIVRTKSSTLQSVLELLCFVAGVGMMVLVTFLE